MAKLSLPACEFGHIRTDCSNCFKSMAFCAIERQNLRRTGPQQHTYDQSANFDRQVQTIDATRVTCVDASEALVAYSLLNPGQSTCAPYASFFTWPRGFGSRRECGCPCSQRCGWVPRLRVSRCSGVMTTRRGSRPRPRRVAGSHDACASDGSANPRHAGTSTLHVHARQPGRIGRSDRPRAHSAPATSCS